MRLLRVNFVVFGLLCGAALALAITLIITVWEWSENPGGIFRGPDGTNWGFVYDPAVSWLLPSFSYAVIIAATGRVVTRVLLRVWRKPSRTQLTSETGPNQDT